MPCSMRVSPEQVAMMKPQKRKSFASPLKMYCNVMAIPRAGIRPPMTWNTRMGVPAQKVMKSWM